MKFANYQAAKSIGGSCGPKTGQRLFIAAGSVLFLWVLTFQSSAQEPANFDNVPTTELRGRIEAFLLSKNYANLIPLLEEYLKRLEESKDPQSEPELERISYSLAFCFAIQGREVEACEHFAKYLDRFAEKNRHRTGVALDIYSASLFAQKRYDEAATVFERILKREFTPLSRLREAKAMLIECYVLPGNWEKAIPILEQTVSDRYDMDLFSLAIVYLCQGYIETNKVEKVFDLLPDLEQSGSIARYSAAFNLSVLQGADKLFEAGRVDLALPLYLIVAPKRLTETWLREQMDLAKGQREAAKAKEGDVSVLDFIAANERLRRLEAEEQTLAQIQSYDEELRHRIAQSYFRQSRTWEALWVYESIMEDFPESNHGEEAAYAGFALAASLGLLERAADFGGQYLERYLEGKYYDDVAHQLAQIYLEIRRFSDLLAVAQQVLDARPDSLFADRLLFLSGISLFQQEKFAEADQMLAEVRRRYPHSAILAETEYWRGMTSLFSADYEKALDRFKSVAASFSETMVGIDSKFRSAVCLYALERYAEAKTVLDGYVRDHPRAPQMAEAHTLLGDIAGADGRLDDALKHYRMVADLTLVQTQIDYAALQIARVLETQENFSEMESSLKAYLDKFGTAGLYAEAIYRIGFAQRAQGRLDEALETYRQAISQYGNDRKAIGIDMIVRDYVRDYASLRGHPPDEEARLELARARAAGKRALALRWQMALDQIYRDFGLGHPAEVEFKPEILDDASAGTMVWLGRLAAERGQKTFARDAFERSLREFPDSEWNEEALLALARAARDEGDSETAHDHYTKLRELFPTSESAALALEEQAQMHSAANRFREAIALLELILEVKEWRGEIWPRALYQIGKNKLAIGETAEAFAYFQRVYVLYSAHRQWAARAYLESAKCLRILGKDSERIATLQEMLAVKEFKELPEYGEGAELLSKETAAARPAALPTPTPAVSPDQSQSE